MSYLEELRKSKSKPQVAYQEFALSTRTKSKHLFCFFEGKDNTYYVARIKRFTTDYYPIKCGGKKSVLDVYALITGREEYEQYKLAFFIDRYFNTPIGDKKTPIYETPCYAIENLYVSSRVFKEILINEFHLSEVFDNDFNKLLSVYQQRQKEFHDAVLLLNSWYACLIEKRETKNIKTGVTIGDKLPKNFVNVSLDKVKSNYDFQTIKETFPQATEVKYAEVEEKMTFFKSKEKYKFFRGKYELGFLIQMIRDMLKDSRTDKKVVSAKIDFSFGDASSLGNQQALNIFEAYAETPQCLLDYLAFVVHNN